MTKSRPLCHISSPRVKPLPYPCFSSCISSGCSGLGAAAVADVDLLTDAEGAGGDDTVSRLTGAAVADVDLLTNAEGAGGDDTVSRLTGGGGGRHRATDDVRELFLCLLDSGVDGGAAVDSTTPSSSTVSTASNKLFCRRRRDFSFSTSETWVSSSDVNCARIDFSRAVL